MKPVILDFEFRKNMQQRPLKAAGVLNFTQTRWIQAIMGPSGVGKSSLAKWMVGLQSADAGHLRMNEHIWFDHSTKIFSSPQVRKVGYLAQGDRLFPHLTVQDNITYGLRNWKKAERESRLQEMLHLTGMSEARHRKPETLSGGEKRRVALAQVLAIHPQLLILDEPFTGLDLEAKQFLWQETKTWIEKFSVPTLLITHDQNEASAFTDCIHHYIQNELRVESAPTPPECSY